jgi:hypothetical protein
MDQNGSRSHIRPRAIKVTQVVPEYAGIPAGRFPESFRGSDLDPRISYPPVIVKDDGPRQLFIRVIANSRQNLKALIVLIKELFCAPGFL